MFPGILHSTRVVFANAIVSAFQLAAVRQNFFFCFIKKELYDYRTVSVIRMAAETMRTFNRLRMHGYV